MRDRPVARQIHLYLRGTRTRDVRAKSSPIPYDEQVGAFVDPRSAPKDAASAFGSNRPRHGTIVCDVADMKECDRVVEAAAELNTRLGSRLVFVALCDDNVDPAGDPRESITASAFREGTQRLVRRILFMNGPSSDVECRVESGDQATALARVAHEEHADLVLVGSPRSRLLRGRVHVGAIDELRMASPCPVVVVPS